MSEMKKLPQGWVIATLDEIAEWGSGGTPKRSVNAYYEGGNIPWVTITDLNNSIVYRTANNITELGVDESSAKLVPKGTILLALYGSIGKLGISGSELTTNQAIATAKPNSNCYESMYLFYFLESQKQHFKNLGAGVTQKNIYLKDVKSYQIPFAPIKEQRRIVEKLDEAFSGLDSGIKELKATQSKLIQQRQSLLKSAVEGSLTQPWREVNSHNIKETGEQLLERILKQRREQWQQQKLAEFAEKGKTPPKGWQDKYPEPVQPDTSELPALPDGWIWASMGQVCQIQGGIQKQPKRRPIENKYPFLRVANVYRNELRLDEVHEIELFGDELQRLVLFKGDILIVEGNGSKSEIGRCAIWNDEIKNAVHQNHLIRSRPVLVLSRYVALWLNSPAGMNIMSTLAATTSGLYTLSVSKISKIPVPIPSVSEQSYIADKIDAEFEAIDRQIEATALGLKQSEVQRKNILKSAFSGQLVPQDPNDEPASLLLEKIKQEREALAKIPKPRKPRKPKKVDTMNTLLEVLTAEKDWIDAQDAFQKCGIIDGASTDRIEEIYSELRQLEKVGCIEIQRRGEYDQLKLIK